MRRSVASLAVTAAIVLGAASGASAEVKWKMGSTFPSKMVQLGTLGKNFEGTVGRVSGGSIQIKFYEPGALVPALELFDAVKSGSVDAGWSTPGYWQGKEPALSLFAAVPFGPGAGEYLGWIYNGGGQDLMNKIYNKHGLHSLICGIIAPEASGWFRKEIKTADDLKGLKMRFFGLGAKVMEKMGVSTQLLAGGDIYPALERGTIDATEFSMPAIDLGLGFYQVAKHYYFPGWHQQSTLFEVLMSKAKWDALSEQERAIIETSCKAMVTDGLAEGEAIQAKALISLKEKGVTLHRWPQEILDKLEAAWNEVAAENAAADAGFKEAWESLQAYRAEYKLWAELGFLK